MKKTSIGGQALIEGLLMMGPENIAIAVRKPDGEIVIDKQPLPKKTFFTKMPLVRGAVNLFRQMVVGIRALMYSADFIDLEEEQAEPSKFDKFLERLFGNEEKLKTAIVYFSVIFSLAFSIGLFILLPNFLAGLLHFNRDTASGVIYLNLFEGLIRIVLFFAYIYFASLMKDIKRVWQYHGAEHKTIHCYEHNEELTVENISRYSTLHPRCGTSFMFLVMLISIIMFSFLGWYGPILNALLRLLLIPVVAGVSFEILKFAGRHSEWPIMKVINAPGMFFQLFTTKEPDDSMIEVAIAAFNNVLVEDRDADKW